MAWQTYDDECPGCQPAMLDVNTGEKLADDHPMMLAMYRVWATLTLQERQAFHRFTCLNSRAIVDVLVIRSIQEQFQKELAKSGKA